MTVPNFKDCEFREKVTEAILEMLNQISEIDRNVFVWTHYRGYSTKQIAEMANCNSSEVEAALHTINLTLYQRIRRLIGQDDRQQDPSFEERPSSAKTLSQSLRMTSIPVRMRTATRLRLCPEG